MDSEERPTTAFILSLIGGVLMALNDGMMFMLFMFGGWNHSGLMGGMMGGYRGMMGSFGFPIGLMNSLMLVGLAAGIIVIIGALMLNTRPAERATWGAIILVFSIISFLGMGGFFIGAILGVIGGAFAISWTPRK